jgi:hypothetical protein
MNLINFKNHLEKLYKQIYNEPHSQPHTDASVEMINEFTSDLNFEKVVELGCGTAPSLDYLYDKGKITYGITMGGEIVNPVHKVLREDMHFTELLDGACDLIIARHVLEHSPMPLILLMEMRRISSRYALVAMPILDSRTINHPNHYSVLPKENWEWLFKLSDWKILKFKQVAYCIEPDYAYKEYRYLLEGI